MQFSVLGAGSWGTALALALARNQHDVLLWGRNPKAMSLMQSQKENSKYLPGISFPPQLKVTSDIEAALAGHDIVLAIPSKGLPDVLQHFKNKTHRIVVATKGFGPDGLFLHQTLRAICGDNVSLATLSGPSFAKEVANNLPTAVTVASDDADWAQHLVSAFHSQTFRVYTNRDVIGVELGGIVKNVLGVAAGIADGLGYGANARSALITRGLSEMMRLGDALGASAQTLMGLSGCGDVILTCHDNLSRNRRFGLAIGKGASVEEALTEVGQAVEAVSNSSKLLSLAAKHHVEMPIAQSVNDILEGKYTPQEVVTQLFLRTPRSE